MTIQIGRRRIHLRRGLSWFLILLAALAAFELFNFSTTEYALDTLFGHHDTLGLASWATVLAIAFCGIDFAGLSRLFTPATDWRREPKEVWLLTAAWFLGGAMNALMTWWAVATALSENPTLGNTLVTREQVLHIVPVFVALLVWMTRVMLIGSLAAGGDHLLNPGGASPVSSPRPAPKPSVRSAPDALNRGHSGSLPGRSSAGSTRASSPRTTSSSGLPYGARLDARAHELDYVDMD